jgi:hypothetical protein
MPTIVSLGSTNTTRSFDDSDYIVTGGDGNDSLTFGNGTDTVTLGNGFDQVTTGDGNSAITVGNGAGDTVSVGMGTNTVTLGSGIADIVQTGADFNTVLVSAAAAGDDAIMGGLTSGDGSDNRLVLTTYGIVNPANVTGFAVFQLANGGANTITLTDANFARLPMGFISVDGGDSGDTINATTLSAGRKINLAATNDVVNLAANDYLGLIGGSGNSINGTGDTIATTANASFNVTGGNDTINLAAGDYLGLIGGT